MNAQQTKIQAHKYNGYEVVNTQETEFDLRYKGFKTVVLLGKVEVRLRDGNKTFNCFAVKR